jgi:hypothetical protein
MLGTFPRASWKTREKVARAATQQKTVLIGKPADEVTANLSPAAQDYLTTLGVTGFDSEADAAASIWLHALAIGYSPQYLI